MRFRTFSQENILPVTGALCAGDRHDLLSTAAAVATAGLRNLHGTAVYLAASTIRGSAEPDSGGHIRRSAGLRGGLRCGCGQRPAAGYAKLAGAGMGNIVLIMRVMAHCVGPPFRGDVMSPISVYAAMRQMLLKGKHVHRFAWDSDRISNAGRFVVLQTAAALFCPAAVTAFFIVHERKRLPAEAGNTSFPIRRRSR